VAVHLSAFAIDGGEIVHQEQRQDVLRDAARRRGTAEGCAAHACSRTWAHAQAQARSCAGVEAGAWVCAAGGGGYGPERGAQEPPDNYEQGPERGKRAQPQQHQARCLGTRRWARQQQRERER
jgi:hypothetical protein